MSQLRKDPITREWVCISTDRAKRPSDFHHREEAALVRTSEHSVCPFCPGNESASAESILVYPSAGGEWSLRVVPNKFPALDRNAAPPVTRCGIYQSMSGVGAHEVVIETREHGKSLAHLEQSHVERVLHAYKERYLALEKDPQNKYILIFRNHGKVAGASINHAHSQIIASPMVPQQALVKIKGVELYEDYFGNCVYCDVVEEELRFGERVVAQNASFVAFAPFASRHPYEMWILPRKREAHFARIGSEETHDLSMILKEALLRLDRCLDDPPYNYMILTTSFSEHFHWHLEIIPRLTIAAGFELGTGIYINVVAPEQAAADLRDASP
jgi:UDPglucose--hexose-1-phosphate uridylyltransferase